MADPSTPELRARPVRQRFDRIDRNITAALARAGVPVLRIGLGVVFLWFGALKFFPGFRGRERTDRRRSAGSWSWSGDASVIS